MSSYPILIEILTQVNGSLAVSRALGDFEYKSAGDLRPEEQLVSPEPEIYIQKRDPVDDEFLVLACDGIFDVFENKELCDLIRTRHAMKKGFRIVNLKPQNTI